ETDVLVAYLQLHTSRKRSLPAAQENLVIHVYDTVVILVFVFDIAGSRSSERLGRAIVDIGLVAEETDGFQSKSGIDGMSCTVLVIVVINFVNDQPLGGHIKCVYSGKEMPVAEGALHVDTQFGTLILIFTEVLIRNEVCIKVRVSG